MEMIAYCGISCSECGALQATRDNDDEKRGEVARVWSEKFKMDIKPEQINCDGCHSEGGRLFSHCSMCEIRNCGREKNIPNCAHCSDYVCEKLEGFFQMVPDTREMLAQIRSNI